MANLMSELERFEQEMKELGSETTMLPPPPPPPPLGVVRSHLPPPPPPPPVSVALPVVLQLHFQLWNRYLVMK